MLLLFLTIIDILLFYFIIIYGIFLLPMQLIILTLLKV